MQWRLVEQAAAEAATGFKKEKAGSPSSAFCAKGGYPSDRRVGSSY